MPPISLHGTVISADYINVLVPWLYKFRAVHTPISLPGATDFLS